MTTIRLRGRNSLQRELRNEIGTVVSRDMTRDADRLVGDLRQRTPRRTGAAAAGWRDFPVRRTIDGEYAIEIENDVDYISQLNAGSSTQAPARFVEREASKYFTQIGPIGPGNVN